jgi:hypothetical protein
MPSLAACAWPRRRGFDLDRGLRHRRIVGGAIEVGTSSVPRSTPTSSNNSLRARSAARGAVTGAGVSPWS